MPVSNAYLSESLRFTTGLIMQGKKNPFGFRPLLIFQNLFRMKGIPTARQLKQNRKGNKSKNALPVC